ncbi:MAG: retropepsin-like aspartic protease [Thermoplasmatales archaeon]|nr:retropepsin-like aspartic protease [Thermoplasmatales archaeon]
MRYKFDPEAPVIVLNVTLGGEDIKKKIEMAIDTGATYTMIPWDIAEVLGYKPELSKDRVPLVTASGVERVPLIILKSVSALGKSADNVQMVVHNLPEKSYVDGLLGLSFLRKFRVCLDFRKGMLEIE